MIAPSEAAAAGGDAVTVYGAGFVEDGSLLYTCRFTGNETGREVNRYFQVLVLHFLGP